MWLMLVSESVCVCLYRCAWVVSRCTVTEGEASTPVYRCVCMCVCMRERAGTRLLSCTCVCIHMYAHTDRHGRHAPAPIMQPAMRAALLMTSSAGRALYFGVGGCCLVEPYPCFYSPMWIMRCLIEPYMHQRQPPPHTHMLPRIHLHVFLSLYESLTCQPRRPYPHRRAALPATDRTQG